MEVDGEPEGEPFDWKWQPPLGYKGRFKQWTRLRGTRLAAGGREERTTVRTADIDYETISRDDRGAPVSRVVYRRITSSTILKRNGREVSDPLSALQARVENAVIGVEIDIKHGPDGAVWSVQGLSRLQRRLEAAAARAKPLQRAPLLRALKWRYSEQNIRREWDTRVARATSPVRVGEAWRSSWLASSASSDLEFSPGTTHRLLALTPARSVISHQISFASRPSARTNAGTTGAGATGRSEQVQSGGTVVGQSVVDRATGLVIEESASLRGQALRGGRAFSWTQDESRRVFTPL